MKLMKRDPKKGYVDDRLWVPSSLINAEGIKNALSFEIADRNSIRMVTLWEEAEHHLIVPRAFLSPAMFKIDWVDARPRKYSKTNVRSKIKLDQKLLQDGRVVPTGDAVQSSAMRALLNSRGGTLQLACVAGDTVLQLNRGGKGFKCTIADAFKRSTTVDRYAWDPTIPTYIRAKQGNRVGLQLVKRFIKKGVRQTITLELEDGKQLRLTNDHQVLTDSGFRSIREGLTVGDSVFVDGKRGKSTRKEKVAYRRIGGFNNHPFARYQSRSYVIEEHRAVAEAALNKMTLHAFKWRCGTQGYIGRLKFIDPAKYHVHHIDENTENNDINNLEVLEVEQHLRQHRPGAAAFGHGVPQLIRIKSLTKGKLEAVYDVVCEDPHHNFVANGVVVHNCGKGKTVVALELAARLHVPTIVVVDNTTLLLQWQDEIKRHLVVPGGVGLIQGQTRDWKKEIVMATYQTLANWADTMPEEVRRWFGLIIWDEGHHVSAPTFSKSAPLFYGYRLALTATPNRADGMHVICQHHVGDIIYKDVKQLNPPAIFFKWTNIKLDSEDPLVMREVNDKNGEVHIGKLAGYLGANRERLNNHVIKTAKDKVDAGHKVLVLSYSVDEVLNLMAIWTANDPNCFLYTDIPYPAPSDVGEELLPIELSKNYLAKAKHTVNSIYENMRKQANMPEKKRAQCLEHIARYTQQIQQHEIWQKTESLFKRRQKEFLDELLTKKSTAGLFTAAVKPDLRFKMLKERKVIFAIMKYGREGLDDKDLSAIIVSEPMSDQNILQQVMGRPRGKSHAELIFLEDNIGPLIGQCMKLRRHLRYWDVSEGGPFKYELQGHPAMSRRRSEWNEQQMTLRVPG